MPIGFNADIPLPVTKDIITWWDFSDARFWIEEFGAGPTIEMDFVSRFGAADIIRTSTPATFAVGNWIEIRDVTNTDWNGIWQITQVVNSTTYVADVAGSPATENPTDGTIRLAPIQVAINKGAGGNAPVALGPLDPANRPTFPSTRVLGGRTGLDIRQNEFLTGFVPATSQPITVVSIFERDSSGTGSKTLYGNTDTSNPIFKNLTFLTLRGLDYDTSGPGLANGVEDFNPHVMIDTGDGVNSEIYIDGASVTTGDAGSNGITLNDFIIGNDGGGGQGLNGTLFEQIIYGRAITDDEKRAISGYAGAKYGNEIVILAST